MPRNILTQRYYHNIHRMDNISRRIIYNLPRNKKNQMANPIPKTNIRRHYNNSGKQCAPSNYSKKLSCNSSKHLTRKKFHNQYRKPKKPLCHMRMLKTNGRRRIAKRTSNKTIKNSMEKKVRNQQYRKNKPIRSNI